MRSEELTLTLWEGAVGLQGAGREQVLLGVVPGSLPQRNALALQRYAELFGPSVELVGKCAHCGEMVEFPVDAGACASAIGHDAADGAVPQWHELEEGGARLRFRVPLPSDLRALAAIEDPAEFAEALLARCVDGELPDDPGLKDAISRRMESLLPGASLSFSLACPECGKGWEAPLDPVELVWRELRSRAERLLVDISALARSHGWSEREILDLGPVRRAAYRQLGAT